jgi:hypothetical protein
MRSRRVCVDARMIASNTWATDWFGLVAFQVTLPTSEAACARAKTSTAWLALSCPSGFLGRIAG